MCKGLANNEIKLDKNLFYFLLVKKCKNCNNFMH